MPVTGPDFVALQARDLQRAATFGRTFTFVDPEGCAVTVHGWPTRRWPR